MEYINRKKVLDNLYEVHFNKQAFLVYARSLQAAKQKSIEYLRVKKKDYESINIHQVG